MYIHYIECQTDTECHKPEIWGVDRSRWKPDHMRFARYRHWYVIIINRMKILWVMDAGKHTYPTITMNDKENVSADILIIYSFLSTATTNSHLVKNSKINLCHFFYSLWSTNRSDYYQAFRSIYSVILGVTIKNEQIVHWIGIILIRYRQQTARNIIYSLYHCRQTVQRCNRMPSIPYHIEPLYWAHLYTIHIIIQH